MECATKKADFAQSISNEPPLKRVIEYIFDNLENEISHDELAEVAGYTKHYFNRYFKSKTSLSPIKWVWHLRLAMAFSKIRSDPSISIESIAISYGYSSLPCFSKAFKRAFGLSPSQARFMINLHSIEPIVSKLS